MEPPTNVQERKMPVTLEDLEAAVIRCRRCPRLVEWREQMAREKRRAFREEEYWGRPVPGFGDPQAAILAVGLAPGAHGSNRTGRMFTGDASGAFLYPALQRAGLASRAESTARDDGLELRGLFLTAVCRCVPPENKPSSEEIRNCRPYLEEEFRLLAETRVIVALGKIAYDAVVQSLRRNGPAGKPPPFAHGAVWQADWSTEGCPRPVWLVGSYHPSRQNTQTGRLTARMFDSIWFEAVRLAGR
jgi:uracil-DNA glycosylase family 4